MARSRLSAAFRSFRVNQRGPPTARNSLCGGKSDRTAPLRITELCLGYVRRDHHNCKAPREVREEHDKLSEAVPAAPEEMPRTSTEGAEAARIRVVREAEMAELEHHSSRTARSQLRGHIYTCCLNLCGTQTSMPGRFVISSAIASEETIGNISLFRETDDLQMFPTPTSNDRLTNTHV